MHRSPASAATSTMAPQTEVSSNGSSGGPSSASRPRRTPSKPQTPGGLRKEGSNGTMRPRAVSSDQKPAKPTFTSSLSFSEVPPISATLTVPSAVPEQEEAGRAQRRSKVEAISKIDRAGTPIALTAGPAATSFIPAQQPVTAATTSHSGPSIARNPLHKPPVHNPSFDISTVRTEAPRYPPSRSKSRLFGLEECPTYYPTMEQFGDCMAYIDSIAPEAKAYGICKIVPPEGWRMPFVLETEKFRFKTRLQRLNSLEAGSRAKINFLEQLGLYHEQGDGRLTIPVIDRKPLDLYALRKAVHKIGGHEEVNRMKGWHVIAKTLGYDEKYGLTIKSAYTRIILPFEIFANRGKSNSGSPLTPMPSTTTSRPPGFLHESPSSPTTHSRMGGMRAPPSFSQRNVASGSVSPPVKPLNLPTLVNRDLDNVVDLPSRPSSAASSLTTLKIKVPGFTSRDGSESELSDEDPPPPRKIRIVHNVPYQKGEVCEVCQRGDDAPKILLCDSCDKGFHTYCLNPPLTFVPVNEEWYCGPCLFAQGDGYGFDEGEDHSISSFQARDKAFAQHWWSRHPTSSQPGPTSRKFGDLVVSEDDVEREFWRLTEDQNDTVEIEYGADVHSTTHGSGSPSLETHPMNQYSKDGWNLNNMPILSESLLRYIRSDISGMTVPWIYVGMMLSAFCWHNEDHYTYSVNYMHWGETKTWYGIPGSDAEKFEEAMMSEAPELFEQQPSLLYQLVTMMNPGRVKEAGVRVVACDQRPNEFVITFPKAYHCGFNHGINFNEAVNFALPDWLADGKEAVLRYKMHSKAPVFSHNELLINITLYSETIKTAIWLKDQLQAMVDEETARRDRIRADVPLLTEQLDEEDGPEEQYQCCICKGYCYLSQITCQCTKLVACVDHADQLCECPTSRRTLRKRYSEAQLEEILAIVVNRAGLPETWRSRLDGLLEVPRPPLKSMRALLTEGERIAHHMPELHDLRALVGRANAWVEKVTALATRKSTGRKKRRQTGPEEDPDRSPDALENLLQEAERLAFDSPEIMQIRQMLFQINSFKSEAAMIMSTPDEELDMAKCKTTLILGNSLNVDLPEIAAVQTVVNRLQWFRKVGWEIDDRTLQYDEVLALLEEADKYQIPPTHPNVLELRQREESGRAWKVAVDRLLASDAIKLDDITALIEGQEMIPTSLDKMRELQAMKKQVLTWQSTVQSQFEGHGTSNAAHRLCKAVRTAAGPLRRVRVPEIDELQQELLFHSKWAEQVAKTAGIAPKQLSAFLENLLESFLLHFQSSDHDPNPESAEHTCFCREAKGPVMVICELCNGTYHPKCVKVPINHVARPFKCHMCIRTELPDDRPSLDALSLHSVVDRYRFMIIPPEMTQLGRIVDLAVQVGHIMIQLVDPLNTAVPCRDFALLAHWHRKLFTLPVAFDAVHTPTKSRIVFEDWLWKRMVEAHEPPKRQLRQRKPKLVLRQSRPGKFACICSTPPPDALVTVECFKCSQGYHAMCVSAPPECLGPDGENWRCPCCTVRDARRHQQGGVVVRVQNSDRLDTDTYIDYRTTISSFSTSILEYILPKVPCILLECIGFQPPVIPEGYVPPTIEEVRASRFDDANDDVALRAKKRKLSAVEPGAPANGTAQVANGANHSGAQPSVSRPHPQIPLAAPLINGASAYTAVPPPTSSHDLPRKSPSTTPAPLAPANVYPSVLAPTAQGTSSITVNGPPMPQWAVNAMKGEIKVSDAWTSDMPPGEPARSRTVSSTAAIASKPAEANGAEARDEIYDRGALELPRDGHLEPNGHLGAVRPTGMA